MTRWRFKKRIRDPIGYKLQQLFFVTAIFTRQQASSIETRQIERRFIFFRLFHAFYCQKRCTYLVILSYKQGLLFFSEVSSRDVDFFDLFLASQSYYIIILNIASCVRLVGLPMNALNHKLNGRMYFQHYMPLPAAKEEKVAEGSEDSSEPQIEFSFVECLMYSFHQVARKVRNQAVYSIQIMNVYQCNGKNIFMR